MAFDDSNSGEATNGIANGNEISIFEIEAGVAGALVTGAVV